jgi:hypothetical protein
MRLTIGHDYVPSLSSDLVEGERHGCSGPTAYMDLWVASAALHFFEGMVWDPFDLITSLIERILVAERSQWQ